jgi:hypothetical protein
MDDEKSTLNCTTLVGNENTYRDTLSSPRAAHAIGQDLHTLRPTNMTVLKRLNENPPGSATRSLPSETKSNTLAHEGRNPLECSLMARIKPDTTMPPKQHVRCGPNTRERQLCHPPKETSASPCSSPHAVTGPNNRSALMSAELSDTHLQPDIKSSHHMTDASPPIRGDVCHLITRPP